MSLTATTLAEAITATQPAFHVTATTGFVAGRIVKVDSESMLIRSVDTDTAWIEVQRGYDGSAAVAHNLLALTLVGVSGDFPPIPPPRIYTYGADGAITVAPGLHRIVKGSAAALTLRAPRADEEGLRMLIVAASAYGHSIALDSGNFAGQSDPQVVLKGAIGDCVELIALATAWNVAESKNVEYASKSPSASPSVSPSKSPSVSPSAS